MFFFMDFNKLPYPLILKSYGQLLSSFSLKSIFCRIYHIEEQLKSEVNKEESKPFEAKQINKHEAPSLEST